MNRIESRMNYLKENNKKAFITYTTAGFPDMKKTKEKFCTPIKRAKGVTGKYNLFPELVGDQNRD